MFFVVHSVPSYDNPQIVLSAHTTFERACAVASAAAQECAATSERAVVVTQNTEELLDAHCLATYCVEDDCWNVTSDLNAYCSNMLEQ